MVTTPDDYLVFHVLRDRLQDELSHHLSSDSGEADWPVVLKTIPIFC